MRFEQTPHASTTIYDALYRKIVADSTHHAVRANVGRQEPPYIQPLNVFETISDEERKNLRAKIFSEATRAARTSLRHGFEPMVYVPSPEEIKEIERAEKEGLTRPYIPTFQLTRNVRTFGEQVALFGDGTVTFTPGQAPEITLQKIVLAAAIPRDEQPAFIRERILNIDLTHHTLTGIDGRTPFVSRMSVSSVILEHMRDTIYHDPRPQAQ